MTVIVYKCNVCKREIELQQNVDGLETIGRCTITHGCRGALYQTAVRDDFVRGKIPESVAGLDNWQQRKVLFNHQQSIERSEWLIIHNLGTYPSVSVFVDRPIEGDLDNREEITPEDIEIVDDNTLILRFDRPWSGIAQLVARQSDPDLLRPFVSVIPEVEDIRQLSNNGEITIATRISTIGEPASLQVELTYSTTQNTTPVVIYDADDQPAIDSAWQTFNKIVFKGKIYTVRSFNGITPDMISGVIGNGSTFRVTRIEADGSLRAPQQNEVIILANSPFEDVDKVTDKYVDVASVTETENIFSFIYDVGEFYAEPDIVQSVYPLIRSV